MIGTNSASNVCDRSGLLADGAHALAIDPMTHHSYIPISKDHNGSPVLWEYEST
jgi:hypothetical protein